MRLPTKNQFPRLPGSALKVPVWGGGVGSYPLLSLAPTHVEVELGCDNRESGTQGWQWLGLFSLLIELGGRIQG